MNEYIKRMGAPIRGRKATNTLYLFSSDDGTTGISRCYCAHHAGKVQDIESDGYRCTARAPKDLPCDECEEYAQQTAAELRAGTQ